MLKCDYPNKLRGRGHETKAERPPDGASGQAEHPADRQHSLISLCLAGIRDLFEADSVYLQYDVDGTTYTLADPDAGLLAVGAAQFDDLTMLCLEYRGPGGA